MNGGMFNHDPAPPANPPLPDRALDQLQVAEARHALLYIAQEAQGLRTALGAMFAHTDQQRLITTEKAQRGVQALIDDLETLRDTLGCTPARDARDEVHYFKTFGGENFEMLCKGKISRSTLLTSHAVSVTCLVCARILRARERNEQ